MTSNEDPASHGHHPAGPDHPTPHPPEETLRTERIQIERKSFQFALKENPRGRFLRITEDVGGRRDTIIVPATGLEDFARILDDMARASGETTPPRGA